ncbi:hypothetical protein AAG747_09300 [Rapidithrix thailandica]|uniref:Uncharacterized protein n=1 Tax=Rapidithrix thailandica TaxID=413964 RepID=A0AAW9SBK0_9BACT
MIIQPTKINRKLLLLALGLFVFLLAAQFLFLFATLFGFFLSLLTGAFAAIKTLLTQFPIHGSLYVWTFSVMGLFLFATPVVFRLNANTKAVMMNTAFLILALGAFEYYLGWQHAQPSQEQVPPSQQVHVDITPGFARLSDTLGYVPKANFVAETKGYLQEKVLYEATYTIDKHGQRITPSVREESNAKGLLFFGCSFTFGECLNDEEALPYLCGQQFQEQYKAYNFGFKGYGTHHSYAALDFGLVEEIVDKAPKYAIYTAIPDHVRRNVNLKFWGHHDPKYELTPEGKVRFAGYFDDQPEKESSDFKNLYGQLLEGSNIYQLFFSQQNREINSEDKELFFALTEGMREKIAQKYPDCEFHIIFWDYFDKGKREALSEELLNGLTQRNFQVHSIHEIIPEYKDHPGDYLIYPPYETHPNGKANRKVAQYIAEKIIQ